MNNKRLIPMAIAGVLALLITIQLAAASGGWCRCSYVTLVNPETLCIYYNLPKCTVIYDHLGCYYCGNRYVEVRISCPGQPSTYTDARDCVTDDGYSCGYEVNCGE